MRTWLDRIARELARLVVQIFYGEVEVSGAERIPATGPLLLVANHGNSLVDPILMLAKLPRRPRFLAKSTLWKNPAVRPLLELAGSIPVYRQVDVVEGADPSKNRETFERCHEELRAGAAVALFPEGISHHEAALQPIKTGAARIALEGAAAGACPDVRIVPVGLVFEQKSRFRSRALVVVGEPLAVADLLDDYARDERAAVRALTDRLLAALERVTLNYDSWRQARLVERAADVYAHEGAPMPGAPPLADRFTVRKAFAVVHRRLEEQSPRQSEALGRILDRYDALLERHGLRDDQVVADYPLSHVALYLFDRMPLFWLGLPAALVGLALNALPYHAVGWIASRAHQRDLPATFKLLGGLLLFPLTWVAEGIVAAQLGGSTAGWWTAILAPTTGYLALRMVERYARFAGEVRAYLWLRLRSGEADALRAQRRALRDELDAIATEQRGVLGGSVMLGTPPAL